MHQRGYTPEFDYFANSWDGICDIDGYALNMLDTMESGREKADFEDMARLATESASGSRYESF